MNKNILKYLSLFLIIFAFSINMYAEKGKNEKNNNRLSKPSGSPSITYLNINNISTQFQNDGTCDVNGQVARFTFPKGSNRQTYYQSGLVWGALINGKESVGGTTFRTSLQPGAIKSDGTAESADAPHVRIYRVRPDWKSGSVSTEVSEEGISEDQVRANYQRDEEEWPVEFGAPYHDENGDGKYNPKDGDVPGFVGADQTVWYVANDLNDDIASNMYGSSHMGIEMQATFWAYARKGALGNMIFKKYKIINKGDKVFKDMYVSVWGDPDVGGGHDDYVGCDTTLSLAYAYNGDSNDDTYGPNPPAVGFDFFQGPIVDGEPTDTAIFNMKKIGGKKNLEMSAHYFFINSNGSIYSDPDLGEYNGSIQFYRLMRGLIGGSGEPFIDPTTEKPTKITLAGDPLTVPPTGWVDGIVWPADDKRQGMVAGPFDMQPGDTQEVVVAQLAAGAIPGVNNLGAVKILKYYDNVAQKSFNNLFEMSSPPPAPQVEVSELDGKIILNWGNDAKAVVATEKFNENGFKFQGYNVYQLPNKFAANSEAVKIVTYDVVDGVLTILNEIVDPNSGAIIQAPQQIGNDSGIKRYISIDRDYINGSRLYNSSKYYFAVTAYSYNPDPKAVPNNLETTISRIEIIPQKVAPGVRYEKEYASDVEVLHEGASQGSVSVKVISPDLVTGHDYKISFKRFDRYPPKDTVETLKVRWDKDTLHNVVLWSLEDVTSGKIIPLEKGDGKIYRDRFYEMQSLGDISPIIDGLQIEPKSPDVGINAIYETDKDGKILKSHVGLIKNPTTGKFHVGTTGFIVSNRAGKINVEKDRDYDRFELWGNYDMEFNFGENSVAWDYFGREDSILIEKVPFSLYRIDPATENKERMYIAILDFDENKKWSVGNNKDGKFGLPAYEPIYGYISKDNPYDPTKEAEYIAVDNIKLPPSNTGWGDDGNPYGYPVVTATAFGLIKNGKLPIDNKVLFKTNKPNSSKDIFKFKAPAVTKSTETAKNDVERISVYPNPYYAMNREELNKYQRFVEFNRLPEKATITIVNLAGQIVRKIQKNDNSQFQKWDLNNDSGLPVASGLYLAYIDMPDLGKTKVLKLSVILERQVLDRY